MKGMYISFCVDMGMFQEAEPELDRTLSHCLRLSLWWEARLWTCRLEWDQPEKYSKKSSFARGSERDLS